MQHDGGVGHRESIVLDIHLVRCGQLRVVEYLILAARHVSYAVLHLRQYLITVSVEVKMYLTECDAKKFMKKEQLFHCLLMYC